MRLKNANRASMPDFIYDVFRDGNTDDKKRHDAMDIHETSDTRDASYTCILPEFFLSNLFNAYHTSSIRKYDHDTGMEGGRGSYSVMTRHDGIIRRFQGISFDHQRGEDRIPVYIDPCHASKKGRSCVKTAKKMASDLKRKMSGYTYVNLHTGGYKPYSKYIRKQHRQDTCFVAGVIIRDYGMFSGASDPYSLEKICRESYPDLFDTVPPTYLVKASDDECTFLWRTRQNLCDDRRIYTASKLERSLARYIGGFSLQIKDGSFLVSPDVLFSEDGWNGIAALKTYRASLDFSDLCSRMSSLFIRSGILIEPLKCLSPEKVRLQRSEEGSYLSPFHDLSPKDFGSGLYWVSKKIIPELCDPGDIPVIEDVMKDAVYRDEHKGHQSTRYRWTPQFAGQVRSLHRRISDIFRLANMRDYSFTKREAETIETLLAGLLYNSRLIVDDGKKHIDHVPSPESIALECRSDDYPEYSVREEDIWTIVSEFDSLLKHPLKNSMLRLDDVPDNAPEEERYISRFDRMQARLQSDVGRCGRLRTIGYARMAEDLCITDEERKYLLCPYTIQDRKELTSKKQKAYRMRLRGESGIRPGPAGRPSRDGEYFAAIAEAIAELGGPDTAKKKDVIKLVLSKDGFSSSTLYRDYDKYMETYRRTREQYDADVASGTSSDTINKNMLEVILVSFKELKYCVKTLSETAIKGIKNTLWGMCVYNEYFPQWLSSRPGKKAVGELGTGTDCKEMTISHARTVPYYEQAAIKYGYRLAGVLSKREGHDFDLQEALAADVDHRKCLSHSSAKRYLMNRAEKKLLAYMEDGGEPYWPQPGENGVVEFPERFVHSPGPDWERVSRIIFD